MYVMTVLQWRDGVAGNG